MFWGEHARVSVPLRGKGRDQQNGVHRIGTVHTSFPSPCGEKVGINDLIKIVATVSTLDAVSVPLRGKGRDQLAALRKQLKEYGVKFPSPCGEKVGINHGIPAATPQR